LESARSSARGEEEESIQAEFVERESDERRGVRKKRG